VTGFGALVRTFVADLVRRRMLWVLAILTVGVLGISYWTTHALEDAMGQGESWSLATRQQASRLEDLASWIRAWIPAGVILFAAQVAPESRRNGTAQFALALGVRRNVIAGAQYLALALVIVCGTLVLHAGFAVASFEVGHGNAREAALAWISLLVPALMLAGAVFSLSLTASAIETYLVFLGVPFVVNVLPRLAGSFPSAVPLFLIRGVQNVGLLFPAPDTLVVWPHLSFGGDAKPPTPVVAWAVLQAVAATAFWVLLGLRLQERHDFGSRTALK
jgi:hypothetical protein